MAPESGGLRQVALHNECWRNYKFVGRSAVIFSTSYNPSNLNVALHRNSMLDVLNNQDQQQVTKPM